MWGWFVANLLPFEVLDTQNWRIKRFIWLRMQVSDYNWNSVRACFQRNWWFLYFSNMANPMRNAYCSCYAICCSYFRSVLAHLTVLIAWPSIIDNQFFSSNLRKSILWLCVNGGFRFIWLAVDWSVCLFFYSVLCKFVFSSPAAFDMQNFITK